MMKIAADPQAAQANRQLLLLPTPSVIRHRCSCRQPFIQFFKDAAQAVAKQFIRPAQAAHLVEREFVEIVLLDVEAAGDVVLDGVEPLPLLGGERDPGFGLPGKPLLVAFFHGHAHRHQRRVGIEGVANQGHDIDQLLATVPLHLLRLDGFVGLPESFQRCGNGRSPDGFGQFLHLPITQTGPIRTAVEDRQGLDLVLVIVDELAEVGQDGLGLFLRLFAVARRKS